MDTLLIILWIYATVRILWYNWELLDRLPVWRGVLSIVIVTLFAPAFFLSEMGEILLEWLLPEDEDS